MDLEQAFLKGLPWAFFLVFWGGVLTSLTPCVYPMIPITIGIFGGRQTSRLGAFVLATAYVLGMAVMYTGLGVLAALLGGSFAFGTLLANPWVVLPLAVLFAGLGLSLLGLWEIRLPAGLQARLATVGGRGMGGAFAMGLVGGIIAAPCTGPILAAILALVATTGNLALGASLLFTYALGIGVLFWILAAFAVSLPKSGPWMDSVKAVLGIAMFVAALYFMLPIFPALGSWASASRSFLLFSLGLTAAGILAGGIHLAFRGGGALRMIRKVGGIALCTVGLFGLVNWALTPERKVEWVASEPKALETAKAQGRPVMIDFWATWCVPCKELEVKTFAEPRVAEELSRFVAAKVDVTEDNEANEALRAKYGADTLPAVILMDSKGKVVHKVQEFMGPDRFLQLLKGVK